MSTKALREIISAYEAEVGDDMDSESVRRVMEAEAELEAIERAARSVVTPVNRKTVMMSAEFMTLMETISRDAP